MSEDYMRKRVTIPSSLKREIVEKSGGKCAKCGKKASSTQERRAVLVLYDEEGHAFEFNHIIRLIDGGVTDISNMDLLCHTCNRSRGKPSPLSQKLRDLQEEINRQ